MNLVAGNCQKEIEQLLKPVNDQFEITSGPLQEYLGLEVKQLEDGLVFVNQAGYDKKVIEKFRMEHSKAVTTPADISRNESSAADTVVKQPEVPFREAVGSLMYLAVGTRPDIAFAVGRVSQHLSNFTLEDWKDVKRILRYIKGTADMGLLFKAGCDKQQIVVYSDADFAGDANSRKSTSGFVLLYCATSIVWGSKRQRIVALSTMEAEYIAASHATQETMWLNRLSRELVGDMETPILLVDNQSAISFAKNAEVKQRSKHIDVRYHFIRDKVNSGEIVISYIPNEENTADILTKALCREKFEKLRNYFGLIVLDVI
jgi:hypothetical protein